jgi:DNA polymerase-1
MLYGGIKLPGCPDFENVRKLDLLPMPALMEMMKYGFAIDRDHMHVIGDKLAVEMAELKLEICSYIPESKLEEFIAKSNLDDDSAMNVDSNQQLCELLFNTLNIGHGRELKRTKSGTHISTGRRQLEKLRIDHPVIGKVLNYRECAKLKNTYADNLPSMAVLHPAGRNCNICGLHHHADTYRIHTQILSTRTATGRYASKDPNLQNIPIRSLLGAAIRAGFVATPGCVLLSVDYSQIELRMLAFVACVKKLIEVFLHNGDPHTVTAMEAFGITEAQVNADKIRYRNPSKNVNFAVVFGETALGLFEQLVADSYGKAGIPVPEWLTLEWCEEFLRKWFDIYTEVREYMELQAYRSYRYGMVWDMVGRIRLVPEVKSVHKRIVAAGLRQAGNMPIQGLASELIKLAIAEIQEFVITEVRSQGIHCIPLLTVHDEVIYEIDESWGGVIKEIVEGIMGNVLIDKDTGEDYCTVPIKAEGKIMQRWEK